MPTRQSTAAAALQRRACRLRRVAYRLFLDPYDGVSVLRAKFKLGVILLRNTQSAQIGRSDAQPGKFSRKSVAQTAWRPTSTTVKRKL